jgi:hypothetical protein
MEPATDTTDNRGEANKNKRVRFGDASPMPERTPTALGRARFATTITITLLLEALQSFAHPRQRVRSADDPSASLPYSILFVHQEPPTPLHTFMSHCYGTVKVCWIDLLPPKH